MNDNMEKRTVAIFCIVAVFVVALSFFAPDIFERARAPVQTALDSVLALAGSVGTNFKDAGALSAEISALKEQNTRLLIELERAQSYKSEVERLRDVLELTWSNDSPGLSEGRLIAKKSGPFRRLFTFQVERAAPGELIINDTGLVGMVTAFSKGVAEGVFLTDPGFSVGVRSVRTGEAAVLSGNFELMEKGKLFLSDYDPGALFEEGDLLETLNGALPVALVEKEGLAVPVAALSGYVYVVENYEIS
jgi:cell shape-determining protein MreC